MIFYTADDDGHTKLAGTQADAKAINKSFEQIDIPTDKSGLMAFVQKLYDDIHDLEQGTLDATVPQPEPPVVKVEAYSTKSVRFEDEFDNMPLAQQLHFASRAMENARDQL